MLDPDEILASDLGRRLHLTGRIGQAIADHLLPEPGTLILAGRDPAALAAACRSNRTNNDLGTIRTSSAQRAPQPNCTAGET
jgi:hypothetical protein